MKQTVSYYDFVAAFANYDRIDQYTRAGLFAIFDYIEDYENESGEEQELDVVAICCEINESTWQEVAENYGYDLSDIDKEDRRQEVIDRLQDDTFFIAETSVNTLVYVAF